MPTYDYKCSKCSHAFEALQAIKADLLKTCPACNEDALVRLIGGGSTIIFKGGGFYQTDYKTAPREPRKENP